MPSINIAALWVAESATTILETGLAIARVAGLDVDSWRAGDPTRTAFKFLAEVLASWETIASSYVKSAFLSTASGDWLTVVASEVYGIDREEATFATPSVTLTNSGGAYYPIGLGDLTVKSSASGKTFTNTSTGTLSSGATVTFTMIADEAGSDSTVLADELDAIVTTRIGVAIDSSTAATARDEESDSELRVRCQATLGALSPNGAPDAYEYVAVASNLTGESTITRSKSTQDSLNGEVTLYVATASGAASGAAVTAVQDAVEQWATPLTVTVTAVSASEVAIDVTATVTGTDVPADIEDQSEAAIISLLSEVPIGGVVSTSAIVSAIQQLLVEGGATNVAVTLTAPSGHTTLSTGQVPTAGTISVTEA